MENLPILQDFVPIGATAQKAEEELVMLVKYKLNAGDSWEDVFKRGLIILTFKSGDEFIFTMDIMVLYPMVPRARAEEAMRKTLEERKKTIPTEDIMELSKVVLDNNERDTFRKRVR